MIFEIVYLLFNLLTTDSEKTEFNPYWRSHHWLMEKERWMS